MRLAIISSRPSNAPATYEQDVGGVYLDEVLMGVLAARLRGHVGYRPLHYLQEGLLHALARHVAGDGWVVALAGDLVYLVYVDDALLGAWLYRGRRPAGGGAGCSLRPRLRSPPR